MLLRETEKCAGKLLYPVAISRCLSIVVYLSFIKHRNQNLCFIKHRRNTFKDSAYFFQQNVSVVILVLTT